MYMFELLTHFSLFHGSLGLYHSYNLLSIQGLLSEVVLKETDSLDSKLGQIKTVHVCLSMSNTTRKWLICLCIKETGSVTMNIFRKIFFSFLIICENRIKLCFHNKHVQYS